MHKTLFLLLLGSATAWSSVAGADQAPLQAEAGHCLATGGHLLDMTAVFDTHIGERRGLRRTFCEYRSGSAAAAIELVGLDTLSTQPTIAATLLSRLRIGRSQPLPAQPYANPSLNVCRALHGSTIAFHVTSGGFADADGQADLCFFGDGSSVSAWTLIYAARGERVQVKRALRARPLEIDIPELG